MPAGFYTVEMAEALTKIALQRKLPASGGRRGGRAVPILASGLWHQVIQTVEQLYVFRPDGLLVCLPNRLTDDLPNGLPNGLANAPPP